MGKGMGVTQSGPMEANKWARARVCAAGKVLEGDDKQRQTIRQFRPL